MQNTLMKGAMKIIDSCLGTRSGERVLIITDFGTQESISRSLRDAAQAVKAEASILTVEPGKMPGEEPSGLMRAAMEQADVIIAATQKTIMHSDAATNACKKGARLFTLTECNEATLRSGAIEADFEALMPVFEKLTEVFSRGETVHVTSEGGTNLRLDITGREAMACSGICKEPGEKMGFPDAELYVAPIEACTEGTIVIDASSSGIGLVREPIVLTVEQGKVIRIEGGAEAHQLESILRATGEESAFVIAELAFGLNYMGNVVGNIIEDEGVYGTGHFALGNNIHFGGVNKASIHIDMVYWRPTITVDGETIMKNGELKECYRIRELEPQIHSNRGVVV